MMAFIAAECQRRVPRMFQLLCRTRRRRHPAATARADRGDMTASLDSKKERQRRAALARDVAALLAGVVLGVALLFAIARAEAGGFGRGAAHVGGVGRGPLPSAPVAHPPGVA
jgi:hypothetical protein